MFSRPIYYGATAPASHHNSDISLTSSRNWRAPGFSGHSFCTGGATYHAMRGASGLTIQRLSLWKFSAFQEYVQMQECIAIARRQRNASGVRILPSALPGFRLLLVVISFYSIFWLSKFPPIPTSGSSPPGAPPHTTYLSSIYLYTQPGSVAPECQGSSFFCPHPAFLAHDSSP